MPTDQLAKIQPFPFQPFSEMLFILNAATGKITQVSFSTLQQLQQNEIELLGSTFKSIVWNDDHLALANFFSKLTEVEDKLEVNIDFIKRSGDRLPVIVRGVLKDSYIYLSASNISREKELENIIGDSLERFKVILEETPTAICITNEEGLFEYVNNGYCSVYGYTREELCLVL